MEELLFKEQTFKILGICMKIHSVMGIGLKEVNYKDAMEIDFLEQGIEFKRECMFTVKYKEQVLRNPYIADFVVFDSIIIEIKSTASLNAQHLAQGLSYLSVSSKKIGLIINFGERSLTWKRIIL